MGLSIHEFYNITWREYVLTVRGFNNRKSREYEHTRAICYMLAAVNRDPKKSFPSMEKFWPLPTDKDGVQDEKAEEKRLMGILEKFKQGKLYKQ